MSMPIVVEGELETVYPGTLVVPVAWCSPTIYVVTALKLAIGDGTQRVAVLSITKSDAYCTVFPNKMPVYECGWVDEVVPTKVKHYRPYQGKDVVQWKDNHYIVAHNPKTLTMFGPKVFVNMDNWAIHEAVDGCPVVGHVALEEL